MKKKDSNFVGRGGDKLKFAIEKLGIEIKDSVAADLGCNIGGFTDCLLEEGASRVYAVDTGYGMLEWKLRCDSRVIVMERTNAMHVRLEEKMDLIVIDVGWTPQKHILPNALYLLKDSGIIMSLFKPQYEADPTMVKNGLVAPEDFDTVLRNTCTELKDSGINVAETVLLPRHKKRKNPEAFLLILPQQAER